MRKILIGVLIIVLVTGIALTLNNGIALGNLQISSIRQLGEKSQKLDAEMNQLKQLKEVTFSQSMDELTESAKQLKSKREEYASLINESTEGELNATVTAEKYEVEYLWVKLGNYATKNGVTLKMNILNNTSATNGVYNLEFTLNGKYTGITEFIYEVENDETLGFKIDKFLLEPTKIAQQNTTNQNNNQTKTETTVDTDTLTATFTVKDVSIKIPAEQIRQNSETIENQNTTTQEGNTVNNTTNNNTVDNTNNTVAQ